MIKVWERVVGVDNIPHPSEALVPNVAEGIQSLVHIEEKIVQLPRKN